MNNISQIMKQANVKKSTHTHRYKSISKGRYCKLGINSLASMDRVNISKEYKTSPRVQNKQRAEKHGAKTCEE